MAFDKFKQVQELNKMRKQAKALQAELEKIIETFEYRGIKVKLNGAQKVLDIDMGDADMDDLVEAINRAMKEIQKKAAKKMMEMGGGLGGLFGN